jgi:hypothetical protein
MFCSGKGRMKKDWQDPDVGLESFKTLAFLFPVWLS